MSFGDLLQPKTNAIKMDILDMTGGEILFMGDI
jgi:hypothetical protein